jgi:Ca2+-transporting ATPase
MHVRLLPFTQVMVSSLNDWQKERQFAFLNDKKEERGVKVIRCGVERVIDVKELLVGDIALLEPGEIIPCDGIFISGHNVRCDESGATGESDAIKKVSYDECIALREEPSTRSPTATDSMLPTPYRLFHGFWLKGARRLWQVCRYSRGPEEFQRPHYDGCVT